MAMYKLWEKRMKLIVLGAIALMELAVFAALAKAAFEVFTLPGAIIFCAIVGAIAISAILGVMRIFRMIDRRDFMKEYGAVAQT